MEEKEKPKVRGKIINEKECIGVIYGKCPCCNQTNVPLCCHHYPIPKAKGGKK